MYREYAGFSVFHIMPEGAAHRTEGQLIPRNVFEREESRFQALRPGVQRLAGNPSEIKEMDLFSLGYVDDSVKRPKLNLRPCFLLRFPHGALCGRFAQLHKSSRQGPFTKTRLNGATTQQYLVAINRDHTHHIARILVMHGAALFAYVAHAIIFRRDTPRKRSTTYRAVLLGAWRGVVEGRRLRGHERNSNEIREARGVSPPFSVFGRTHRPAGVALRAAIGLRQTSKT